MEERVRSRRIALLKPYDLRFHVGTNGDIDLVFFNGKYASSYPEFVRNLLGENGQEDDSPEWTRAVRCSRCQRSRERNEPLADRAGVPRTPGASVDE
jgi:hypothetical protein